MDTVTVVIRATDSNAPVVDEDATSGSLMDTLADNTMFQAAAAGLVLFVLMGSLMIRGQSRKAATKREEWPEPLKFDRQEASVNFQARDGPAAGTTTGTERTYEFNV